MPRSRAGGSAPPRRRARAGQRAPMGPKPAGRRGSTASTMLGNARAPTCVTMPTGLSSMPGPPYARVRSHTRGMCVNGSGRAAGVASRSPKMWSVLSSSVASSRKRITRTAVDAAAPPAGAHAWPPTITPALGRYGARSKISSTPFEDGAWRSARTRSVGAISRASRSWIRPKAALITTVTRRAPCIRQTIAPHATGFSGRISTGQGDATGGRYLSSRRGSKHRRARRGVGAPAAERATLARQPPYQRGSPSRTQGSAPITASATAPP